MMVNKKVSEGRTSTKKLTLRERRLQNVSSLTLSVKKIQLEVHPMEKLRNGAYDIDAGHLNSNSADAEDDLDNLEKAID